jgi:hypothetical protein
MIAFLVSTVLAAIIRLLISAYLLDIAKRIVLGWVWLYSFPAPKEEREGRRAEGLSHVHEFENALRKKGYAPRDIAVRLLERWARGMPDDMMWSMPFVPGSLAGRTKDWADSLRHYRVPNAMVAGVDYQNRKYKWE